MSTQIIQISNLNFQYGNQVVLKDFDWEISSQECWMLGGLSGSGKTTLAKIISGEIKNFEGKVEVNFDETSKLAKKVLYVSNWFQFSNLEGDRNFYYQQRYNQFAKNDTLTVFAELNHFGNEENLDFKLLESYLKPFGFENFKNQQLIELSSGEHKKLQLLKALWLKPQVLIIDQPYTGLDVKSRQFLNQAFDDLIQENVTLILINNDDEFPESVQYFVEIENGKLVHQNSPKDFSKGEERTPKSLPFFLQNNNGNRRENLIKLEKINISYGEKQVLKNIDWEVNSGEQWLLQGHNGSGKSTLLSLLNGDHPQAYANEIYLFGRKRGSGESIWDIKEKIGMISPELHWYFDMNANVGQTIASGFFDSMSLYQKLSFDQQQQLEQLLYFFDLKEDKNKKLNTLPLGKQRLALLARTLIKKPKLLILDEPCQGMDNEQTQYFNQVIDDLASQGQSLIYVGYFESQLPKKLSHKLVLENGTTKIKIKIKESVL
ncbi:ATP-binding cassette domain-containing protein [Epilithonimonas ginsengisoli]|uniref:ATP-binding cassette domain-containing protein n=1 Tax=Epilithonimonas ginsengisoli TaxID=1245592 RepID=A0ABU4JEV6_9FLAO|nr:MULTISPECIES: ATP-binding cassette domain-containing protein [Chryseobacterium group]MBV6879565.1 ATP-binding cassette domain-containing protein [Epilithonimonas sp. FP105]MDW8548201.1 ATP-binding cassette domain-containing protein [Epilithonimonas ginsengisoli]